VLLIPIVIGSLLLIDSDIEMFKGHTHELNWVASWFFMGASITDFFDGYFARKRNIVTVFGSFLDPIADKFLTVSSLIMLQSLERIPTVIVIILVLREMYMTSLRLLANSEGISVPVSPLGKWKTAILMCGIPMLMANSAWLIFPWPQLGLILIYVAFILSVWSAFTYSGHMIAKLKVSRAEKREERRLAKEAKIAAKKNKDTN